MAIRLTVNGRVHSLDVDPSTPLLYVLNDELRLNGPKFGCGLGQCGACTAIVNGRAVRSCITVVSAVADAVVVTLEGLGTVERPHPLQQAFIDKQAAQCGFCLNGVILTAKACLEGLLSASSSLFGPHSLPQPHADRPVDPDVGLPSDPRIDADRHAVANSRA